MDPIGTAFGVVFGGIVTIATALFVESMRRPQLDIEIEDPPQDVTYSNRPAQTSRYLRVLVNNKRLPAWAAWLMREAAIRCQAELTFHECVSGRRLFLRAMPGRWASSIEPVSLIGNIAGQPFQIYDPGRWTVVTTIDIPPGEKAEPLDVAVRFDSDTDCFGWNNESYFSNPPWRNPDRALPRGQYLVKVTIRAAGQRCEGFFVLNNAATRSDFRLERASREERRKVEAAEA